MAKANRAKVDVPRQYEPRIAHPAQCGHRVWGNDVSRDHRTARHPRLQGLRAAHLRKRHCTCFRWSRKCSILPRSRPGSWRSSGCGPARPALCRQPDDAHRRGGGDVEIVVEDDPSAWPALDIDPVKLKQVFVNLIGNAIKFTPAGGRVTVRAGSRRSRCRFASAIPASACGPRISRW